MLEQLNTALLLSNNKLEELTVRSRKMVESATWQARCELVTTLLTEKLAIKNSL